MNEATREFIRAHRTEDVRELALHAKAGTGTDLKTALEQISGWQTARRKLPDWAATEGLTYPPRLAMEQCSSETTARYKAGLAARLLPENRRKMVDLTGGFGVDFSYLAPLFDEAVYVERQETLCDAARGNFPLLGIPQARIVCGDGVAYLNRLQDKADLIFLDPARRDAAGRKTVVISDCTPDILAIKDILLQKSRAALVKLSPMLDITDAVRRLGCVNEVHVIAVHGECKELLLVLTEACELPLKVTCVNDKERLEYLQDEETGGTLPACLQEIPEPPFYLYEPNTAVMKAGAFRALCARWAVTPVAPASHLFISPELYTDFPGRIFQISAISSGNKRSVKTFPAGLDRANVAVRNYPLSAEALRRRLHLKDGGDVFIFGTSLSNGNGILLRGKKIAH